MDEETPINLASAGQVTSLKSTVEDKADAMLAKHGQQENEDELPVVSEDEGMIK